MASKHALSRHISLALAGLLTTAVLLPTAGFAQNSTATIRGHVGAPSGQTASEVVATNLKNGFTIRAQVGANGNYTLPSLPPGNYRIEAKGTGLSRDVTVQVGQALTLNLEPTAAPSAAEANAANLQGVTVSAALIETRTSEVGTNISQTQINTLPQNERNFLDFAKLVPGVTVSRDPNSKTFSAGGQSAENVNVFIDGASLKNNVLKGGVAGQDSTRGNPFSQEAVQEFRVLTQNYKAEYEQAGTAIITAVTKSGTNEFHGSVYDYFQNKSMISQDSFDKKNNVEKPDYRREQRGFSLGGPVLKDALTFFVNYDERKDVGNNTVQTGDPRFAQYNGTFPAPFHEKTFFGKLSWQVNQDNNVDMSLTTRRDNEVLGFGGATTYSARTDRKNRVDDLLVKWQSRGDGWTNDLMLDAGQAKWNPSAAEPDVPQQTYENNIAVIGGAVNMQNKGQNQRTLRDDLTFTDLNWHGQHTVKMGIKYAAYGITVEQNNNAVPSFYYQEGANYPGGFDSPYRAVYSPLGANANLHTNQFGAYVQDDWDVTQRLQLNLGLRWDYETNALNKDYVTPAAQIPTLEYLGLQNNISNGNNRSGYKGAIQPRLGFSLDVSGDGDQSTTIFGGAGRYYDRTPFDWIAQEAIHAAVPNYTFYFSPPDANGNPTKAGTIAWNPAYLSKAGLDGLIAQGVAGFGTEIDAVNNKTRPPHTDQFSLGVRQVWGDWTGSLTLARVLGYDQFTWAWNRVVAPGFVLNNLPGSPYGVVLHNVYKKTQSSSVLIGIDKPYTKASGWGVGLAYTYQDARQQGNDNYSLDYVSPAGYPGGHVGEKHHLVANGIVTGPWDTRLTGIFTYGSGLPFDVFKSSANCDYNCSFYHWDKYGKKYVNLDLSIAKEFRWGENQALELRLDVMNVFNRDVPNDNGYDLNYYSPTFGKLTSADPNLSRRFQIGARYSF
ncbi:MULTISPECIES: TonB-dependent receptor [Dyella]|uniref:TonB-dependent receptor n=2 Tax=Dyella TaxID=231454 RepID=A0A4R0YPQ8_9GAMM|nr:MULTISPECIES: carboxypeptidase regulatory-like domain-containing protein [Dyella]TBR35911.1 TonB-dependent receptor [Dyella terrae]TCI08541.1 TonB-dependent receptor [Dyella soli]